MKKLLFILLLVPGLVLAQAPRPLTENPTTGQVSPTTLKNFKAISLTTKVHGAVGATETFNAVDGNVHTAILDQNCTVTLTGWAVTERNSWMTIWVVNNGGFDFIWPASVNPGGSAPPINLGTNTVTRIDLSTRDGGTTVVATSSALGTFVAGGPETSCTGATIGAGSKNNAGFVTATTTGVSTVVVTFSVTATTGWAISPSNNTTANMIRQTASSTTTATFVGTTVSGDVISYIAIPY